ncbi:MAG: hypothetical protein EXS03_07055 [Phycisphaerales bacterium]|nr:hypothetical protein [Phycisphaerales bacterium]
MKCRRIAALLAGTVCVAGILGCYEKVIRTTQGDVTTQVNKPDFDEKQGALDEVLWGPVPAGQDPEAYYRKKKRLMAQ